MPRTVMDLLAFGLPFVPVIPLMAASPTIGLATDFSYDFGGKWLGIFYLIQNYSDFFDYTLGGLILGGAVWAVWHRLLRMHMIGWILLVAGTAAYYAIPRVLFGSWGADLRLPVALAFILMGFMRIELPNGRTRYAFLAFVIGLAVTRFVSVQIAWQNLDVAFQDFRRSVDLIDPGSSILVVQADAKDQKGTEALNQPLSHAATIAMIERSSFVSTAFAVPGKQVLVVKPEYHDMANIRDDDLPSESDLIAALKDPESETENYWYDWTDRFDYVYVLYAGDAPNPAPGVTRQIYRGQRFQLFEIMHPDDDDED
jgi:hypothetical protein